MRIVTVSSTILLLLPSVASFLSPTFHRAPAFSPVEEQIKVLPGDSSSMLKMAGFGGSGGGGSTKKKGAKKKSAGSTVPKLKPKGQWDKYKSMKKASAVKVAVRVVKTEGDAEWFEVGKIKSEGDEFTELAVVVQRGMIAEHAKRLHPLQFLPKDQVEWGYADTGDDDTWVAVDRNIAQGAPSGIEKKIGFVGNPDPSGFYSKTSPQFSGDTSAAPLASGSAQPDRSVLPRVK